MELNKYIDHTNLKANATKNDIKKLCDEAIKYNFASVCINPFYVKYAHSLLKKSNVAAGTVIGFPLGANTTKIKVSEVKQALKDGAEELDMVINIGALKAGDYDYVEHEIAAMVEAANGYVLKVIIETSYLNEEEIIKMCEICKNNFVHFIKTSTGFSDTGATIENVSFMRQHIGDILEIKASGGIKNYDDAIALIDAGATRIGTSNGIKIMEGLK
ncbi:MAG: deoxyribose-phosphate aldolase [Bacilli bacterium]|nr:deoxyribose-phosphate aldolase [Bacilli bacterium]MDD3304878.1 deoxyribose-phosphate aldolase [Bacilli bacterium]MDD4053522.1 deoxyribose-phosphate aldolase [Bacilli bacterium]MDD4411557.1 deoxyribose-phosphate aldolase [Bacilli bacterium]